jgi:hypothetical protein
VSDERLRALERAWRASGAEDDEVAWLQARLRAGTLDRRKAELAAYCGSRAAQRACEVEPTSSEELVPWVTGLRAWGKETVVRALVAVARRALPVWEERYPRLPGPVLAMRAAEEWCRCPCAKHAELARVAGPADEVHDISTALDESLWSLMLDAAGWAAAPPEDVDDTSVWWQRLEAYDGLIGDPFSPLRIDRPSSVSLGLQPLEADPWRELYSFFRGTRSPDVTDAISSELVPWALA